MFSFSLFCFLKNLHSYISLSNLIYYHYLRYLMKYRVDTVVLFANPFPPFSQKVPPPSKYHYQKYKYLPFTFVVGLFLSFVCIFPFIPGQAISAFWDGDEINEIVLFFPYCFSVNKTTYWNFFDLKFFLDVDSSRVEGARAQK